MIGNDIIDLNLAATQSKWRRKGFLNKIFTQQEQNIIFNSKVSFLMVWLLWSIKESAYKVYVQQHDERFFKPSKFHCELISKAEAIVSVNNDKYYTRSQIDDNYIYTTATLKNTKKTTNSCFKIRNASYVNQHNECYKRLKLAVSKKLCLPIYMIKIKKNSLGVPKLHINNKQLEVSFSLTHHCNYCAYSILN